MTTLATTPDRESDLETAAVLESMDPGPARAALADRLARAADREAVHLLQQAERLSRFLEADRERRQKAWGMGSQPSDQRG